MARKKSGRYAAEQFRVVMDELSGYACEIDASPLSPGARDWAFDAALIKVAVAFEKLMLECLIVALNNDSSAFSKNTGIAFPKHITQDHCEYLITGGGYFDYSGRSGLLKDIKRFTSGSGHWLHDAVAGEAYYHHLELLLALRNFAAHESPQAKKKMKAAIYCWNHQVKDLKSAPHAAQFAKAYAPSSAGSWVRRQGRFTSLLNGLSDLADTVETTAPR
ncbi:hypothetical protein SMD44_p10084 (plasmid) [Streptomyces alboflavus]|uniref:Uncharacterized protein n=1 Tax=Streptomyces alboflavus TaxID=67267 RepID=A0A291W3V4_9ACTN|nr:hypothetical protein [Streptomyces alboflavus]ATM24583.1 hypothetical protein SMD44_p10084 [Streptomyces alboflavus]